MTHFTFLAEEDALIKSLLRDLFREWGGVEPEDVIEIVHASHQRSLERLRGEAEKMLEAYDAGYDTNTRPDRLLKEFIALLSTNQ